MRILHLGKYYPPAPGGMETYVRALAEAQAARGHDVSVFCLDHLRRKTRRERIAGVEVTRLQPRLSVAQLDYVPGLARAIRRHAADIVHVHVPNPSMILATLASRTRAPMVVTYQSDHVRQRVRGPLFRPVEMVFYEQVAAILTTSPEYPKGSSLLQRFAKRVHVVPMGIPLKRYLEPSDSDRAAAEALRERHGSPLWLGCGRLIYYKDFITAVRALRDVRGKLILIGDGPERDAIEAEAVRLGVRDRLVLAGVKRAEEVVPYYLAATAFWFPSNARSEAFGLVQVEAMASSCPVLNTTIPASGVAWVSKHRESGLTTPVNDPAAFAAAARMLDEDPGLRAELAANGARRARAEFGDERMVDNTMRVYEGVLSARKRRGSEQPLPAS